MNDQNNKPSGMGIAAGVLGALAAIGGIAVAASSSGSKRPPLRGATRTPLRLKKPCGCGR
jgi:hypothetical protein